MKLIVSYLLVGFLWSANAQNQTATNNTLSTDDASVSTSSNSVTPTTDLDVVTTTATTTTLPPTTKPTPPPTRSPVRLQFVERRNQDSIEHPTFVGANFKIDCRVKTADDSELVPPKMTWWKDNIPLQDISYRILPSTDNLADVYVLELKDLLPADDGKYKCTADNGFNKEITYTITLKISERKYVDKPELESFGPINPSVEIGNKVEFHCKCKHVKDHTPLIQWVKYSSRPIVITNHTENSNSTANSTLPTTEPPLDTTLAGGLPLPTLAGGLPLPTTTVAPEDTLLSANFLSSDRNANISYVENGTIYEEKTLKIGQADESALIIETVTFEDTAVYVCFIFNQNGFIRNVTKLIVTPIPPLTVDEMEEQFITIYGHKYNIKYPLSIVIGLPLFLLVLLIIGCIYWHENEKRLQEVGEKKVVMKEKQYSAEDKKPLIIPDIYVISGTSDEEAHSNHDLHFVKESPHHSQASLQHSNSSINHQPADVVVHDIRDAAHVDITDDTPTGDWEHV